MRIKTATLAGIEIGLLLLTVCGAFYVFLQYLFPDRVWEEVALEEVAALELLAPFTSWEWKVVVWLIQALTPLFFLVLSLYYNDLYDLRLVRRFGAFSIRFPQFLGISLIPLFIFYLIFLSAGLDLDGSSLLTWMGAFLAIILPLRGVLYGVMRIRTFAERVLILGTSPLAWEIAKEIEDAPHLGYAIVGLVEDGGKLPGRAAAAYSLFGPLDRLSWIIKEARPDRIIVALTERRGRLPVEDLLNARMFGIMVEDGVEVHERFTGKLAIESLGLSSYLFFSKDFKKSPLQMALRRTMSFMVALVGLIVTAPLMLIIALAIKLDSPGPIFFFQERAGFKGHTFRLVKFRTMHPASSEDEGSVWSRDMWSRITRVGKLLRRLSLDELPQFYNILRGDMNLVGPRPEMAGNVPTMTEQIKYYPIRMQVRPGLTGWAQVKHGYAVSREDVTEKMRYDLYYVKHMSLWFDLRIIVDTVKIVMFGPGHERTDSYYEQETEEREWESAHPLAGVRAVTAKEPPGGRNP